MSEQYKAGYVRGVDRIILAPVLTDTGEPDTTVGNFITVDTPNEFSFSPSVKEGETLEMNAGGKLIFQVKDPDVITGAEITFKDAKVTASIVKRILGGNVSEYDDNGTMKQDGWELPTIEQQQIDWDTDRAFWLGIVTKNYSQNGKLDGYVYWYFRYCKGTTIDFSIKTKEWGEMEYPVNAEENSINGKSAFGFKMVNTKPDAPLVI